MSRASKLLSFAMLAFCLSPLNPGLPRAMASTSLHDAGGTQAEPRSASDLHAPDGRWALLLMGLFAVWAIATYAQWDESAKSAEANQQDEFAEHEFAEQRMPAMNRATQNGEWAVAEQKLARIPPGSETRSGTSGQSRVA
jgi:hypothetical protein